MLIASLRLRFSIVFISYLSSVHVSGQFNEQFYRKVKKGYLSSHYVTSNHTVSSSLECGHFCLGEKCCFGFNYKSKKRKKEINCQLTNSDTPTLITNQDNSWQFFQAQRQSFFEYGTKEHPGKSCSDILRRKCPDGDIDHDGIYWISLHSNISAVFPVLCDMTNGGWTLVFKGVAGVSGVIMSNIWQNSSPHYENELDALNIENSFKHHYKNRIVQEWSTFNPAQARVVLYSNRKEDLVLKFNAQNTNNLNWFAEENLLTSPWQDIHLVKNKNYFSLIGNCGTSSCRSFHINHHYGGCGADTGWLTIENLYTCAWETRLAKTSFLYSKKTSAVNWNSYADVGVSEVFTVYLR